MLRCLFMAVLVTALAMILSAKAFAARPAAGDIGAPLPFRLMHVEDGVLRYGDGKEVALMGTNYYPHAWDQYVNMKAALPSLEDLKTAITEDIKHLKQMGVQVVRVGVYDREISNGQGAVIDNEHLLLIDWLVHQCRANGIYCYLTLMKYWWSPDGIASSFSNQYAKEELFYVDDALSAQRNFVTAFLSRPNRFTGIRYADEPAVCVVEILNEPWYTSYEQLNDPSLVPDWQRTPQWERNVDTLRDLFETYCQDHSVEETRTQYITFQRQIVGDYIQTMVDTIRATGLAQPIVYNLFAKDMTGFSDIQHLLPAIAASPVDAVSIYHYIPGLNESENDDTNLLPQCEPSSIWAGLEDKARLAYEFDATGTHLQCTAYPAQARRLRQMGVQIACQFQYDTDVTASRNADWYPHYLNYFYTPAKMAAFAMACRLFPQMPREMPFDTPMPSDEQVWGAIISGTPPVSEPSYAVSFPRNQALLSDSDMWINASPMTDWQPFAPPSDPKTVISTGSNPYFESDGNGLVVMTLLSSAFELHLMPDVEKLGPTYTSEGQTQAARLLERSLTCKVLLPDWGDLRIIPHGSGDEIRVLAGTAFQLEAGSYMVLDAAAAQEVLPSLKNCGAAFLTLFLGIFGRRECEAPVDSAPR